VLVGWCAGSAGCGDSVGSGDSVRSRSGADVGGIGGVGVDAVAEVLVAAGHLSQGHHAAQRGIGRRGGGGGGGGEGG